MFELAQLQEKGYALVPSFFEKNYMFRIAEAMDKSYETCRDLQVENGIAALTDGTVHHLLAFNDPIYLDILYKLSISPIYQAIKHFFGGNFIVNSYGGVINLTDKPSYVAKIHRDIRFYSGSFPLMLNMLIMLDDFTLANGATYLLAGSHQREQNPEAEEFYKMSDRAVGKKGTVLFFNSNLWHAAGLNKTSSKRRALTITFTKPFMKPQLDYARAIGYQKVMQLSTELQQMIGFYSRIPSDLNEWYQKPENRFYRPGQD